MNNRYRMLIKAYVMYRYRRLLYDYDTKQWIPWEHYLKNLEEETDEETE